MQTASTILPQLYNNQTQQPGASKSYCYCKSTSQQYLFPLKQNWILCSDKTPGQGADQQCNFQEIQRKIGRTTAACRGNQSATRIGALVLSKNQEQNKGCVTNTESYINNSKKNISSNSNIARCAQRYCLSISSQSKTTTQLGFKILPAVDTFYQARRVASGKSWKTLEPGLEPDKISAFKTVVSGHHRSPNHDKKSSTLSSALQEQTMAIDNARANRFRNLALFWHPCPTPKLGQLPNACAKAGHGLHEEVNTSPGRWHTMHRHHRSTGDKESKRRRKDSLRTPVQRPDAQFRHPCPKLGQSPDDHTFNTALPNSDVALAQRNNNNAASRAHNSVVSLQRSLKAAPLDSTAQLQLQVWPNAPQRKL